MAIVLDGTGTIDTGDLTIDGTSGGYGSVMPTVYAEYRLTIEQNIDSLTILNFDTKVTDTNNAVTVGSSWKFTAPFSGIYSYTAKMQTNSFPFITGHFLDFVLYKNGSSYTSFQPAGAAYTGWWDGMINGLIRLNVGDYIHFTMMKSVQQSGTGLKTYPDTHTIYNKVAITRIGS